MLRMALRFGLLDLNQAHRAPDAAYFSLPALGILVYPAWLTPALGILGLLGLVALSVFLVMRQKLSVGRSLLGGLFLLLGMVVLALLAMWIWGAILDAHPMPAEYFLEYRDFEGSAAWRLGLLLTTAGLSIAAVFFLLRRFRSLELAVGGLLAAVLVIVAATMALGGENPLTTPYLSLPLAFSVGGLAAVIFIRRQGWKLASLFLAALLVLVLIVPLLVGDVYYPSADVLLPVLFVWLVVMLLLPQLALAVGKLPEDERK